MCDSSAMRKLLGFLLALLLAIPAIPAGPHQVDFAPASVAHDMAGHHMMMHHEHHDGTPAPSSTHVVHHECVGCIAPIDVRLYRPVAQPQRPVSLQDRPANSAYLLTSVSAPETPPPRTFV
jgi:hypothetical protein